MTVIDRLECAFSAQGLSSAAKFVLTIYAFHANAEAREAWVSVDTICRKTGLSRSTVIRERKKLLTLGLLVEVHGRRERKTKTYRLGALGRCQGDIPSKAVRGNVTPQRYHLDTSAVSARHPNKQLSVIEPRGPRRMSEVGRKTIEALKAINKGAHVDIEDQPNVEAPEISY